MLFSNVKFIANFLEMRSCAQLEQVQDLRIFSVTFFRQQKISGVVGLAERHSCGATLMSEEGTTPEPVADALLEVKPAVKSYRLMHKREDGKNWPLLLQNRLIQAESAEEALKAALQFLGDSAPFVCVKDGAAWAIRASGKFIDIWESELELE